MATILNNEDENEQPVLGGAPSTAPITAPGSMAPTPNKPQGSGRFTNLNAYLKANQKTDLAGSVANNIQNKAQQIGTQLQGAQGDFTQQAENARVQYNPNLVQNVLNNAGTTSTNNKDYLIAHNNYWNNFYSGLNPELQNEYNEIVNRVVPMDIGPGSANEAYKKKNQEDLNNFYQKVGYVPLNYNNWNNQQQQSFYQQRDAQYSGPQQLNNATQLQTNAQNLANNAQNLGTEKGRFNTLRTMYNKPSYTSGQQRLDNVLLQTNPNAMKQLQGVRSAANQTKQAVNRGVTSAENFANQYKQEAAQTKEKTAQDITNSITGFDTYAANQMQNAINNREAKINIARQLAGNDLVEQGLLDKLDSADGRRLTAGQELYDVDLRDFINPSTFTATKQNVLNDADYARINALRNLAGDNLAAANSNIFDSYNNANFANDFTDQNAYTYDVNRLLNSIDSRKADYTQVRNPVEQSLAEATNAIPINENFYNIYKSDYENYLASIPEDNRSIHQQNALLQKQQQMDAALAGLEFERNKQAEAQRQLEALANQYKVNRKLGVNNAITTAPNFSLDT